MQDSVEAVLPHLAPPAPGFTELKATDLPEPIYRVDYLDTENDNDGQGRCRMNGRIHTNGTSGNDLEESLDSLHINGNAVALDEVKGDRDDATVSAAPIRQADALNGVDGVWKPDDWQWATLKRNERVTREDWWQEVREFDFELDNLSCVQLSLDLSCRPPRNGYLSWSAPD